MARTSYAARIRSRIAELEGVIKAAEAELNDLRIAVRVIESLGPDDDAENAPYPRSAKSRTVADLIADILTAHGPLESRDIFEKAKAVHDTTPNTVSTTLSRMKDQGLVVLQGRHWGLINKDNILNDPALMLRTDEDVIADWEAQMADVNKKAATP